AGSSLAVKDAEGRTSFHGGEDRDQALGNALFSCQLAGVVFFANFAFQKATGSPGIFSPLLGVLLESERLPRANGLEVREEDAVIRQEVLHGLGVTERQIALEDQAIGAEQRTGDFVGMFVYKGVHGVLPFSSASVCQSCFEKEERRFNSSLDAAMPR